MTYGKVCYDTCRVFFTTILLFIIKSPREMMSESQNNDSIIAIAVLSQLPVLKQNSIIGCNNKIISIKLKK